MKNSHQHFDVIIIGVSYSALSATVALGRSLRKVLILDSGQTCELTDNGHLKVESFQKTNVEAIFSCGDNASLCDLLRMQFLPEM